MLLPDRFPRLALGLMVTAVAVGCGGGNLTTPPPTGTLEVTTSTSGTEQDADGYSVLIDGGPAHAIGTSATLAIAEVTPGDHTVQLTEVAANCTASGDNPRTGSVTAGETASVGFEVTCVGTTGGLGSIQVTTATTGSGLDTDGYTLTVDAGAAQPIELNATLALPGLAVGTHALALSGIANNCHLDGDNPRMVEVVPGPTAVTFALNCLGADALIAFTSNAVNLLAVLVVNPDGTGLRNLTPTGASESNPRWSPDGRKILFSKNDDLYVMQADGSGRTRLFNGQGESVQRWSPDGRMIAFAAARFEGQDIFEDLWVMQADGSGQLKLATDATDPSWSPDGRRIAYVSAAQPTDVHLRIINSDGSGDLRLTAPPLLAFQPAWSPDGAQIAFVTVGEKDIFLIHPDGTGEVNLTQGLGDDDSPTWSPDGSRIAFNLEPLGQPLESEVAVMNRDGSGRTNLTNRPGFDLGPGWSPDGSRIVYYRFQGEDSEIYVMNADGSSQTDVSNRPDSDESAPDWNGQGMAPAASRQPSAYDIWLRARGLETFRPHR